ncbi:MAG: recombinase family protein [Lachnospiraceae bacterium]|nr:recombinase family protein [Lachnospiraceae bacterium]
MWKKDGDPKTYQAAIYLRLSREDGDVPAGSGLVSDSISNQKALILDFLKSHTEIEVHSVYADDGYSGVNFDRPDFQRMLEDIRQGLINCVVVKDLSRFGRNYIEAGRYIEKIFPMLGVRFIAVTDDYDSVTAAGGYGGDMVVPFKNLINDAYCRDISVKIRSHLEMKRKKGEYIGAFVVYGYLKDKKNKNRLVIDEYAAGVVRDIFAMKLRGMSQQTIADRLNKDGILSPMEYKKSIGIHLETTFKKGVQAKWSCTAVLRILKNEIYAGVLAQGKQTTPNYKIKTRVMKPEAEWVKVRNAHELIIPKNDFDLVQELLKQDTRIAPNRDVLFPLAGLLYCGDCGETMVRKTVPAGGKKYVYYVCAGNKKDKTVCSPHRIAESALTDSVLRLLQTQIEQVLTLEAAMQAIEKAPELKADVAKIEERIARKRTELEKAEKRKRSLYEDFKDGILSRKEYLQIKEEYDRRIGEAEGTVTSYEREKEMILEKKTDMHDWIRKFKQYRNIRSLDRNAAAVMIKRILVYTVDRIEVTYNFADGFAECREYAAVYGKSDEKEAV